jgi:hypothetical protein
MKGENCPHTCVSNIDKRVHLPPCHMESSSTVDSCSSVYVNPCSNRACGCISNFMEHSLSSEAYSCSAGQEIVHLSWNSNIN